MEERPFMAALRVLILITGFSPRLKSTSHSARTVTSRMCGRHRHNHGEKLAFFGDETRSNILHNNCDLATHTPFHRIRDEGDYVGHAEYIRMNPVRACLVERPELYPYSSGAAIWATRGRAAIYGGLSQHHFTDLSPLPSVTSTPVARTLSCVANRSQLQIARAVRIELSPLRHQATVK